MGAEGQGRGVIGQEEGGKILAAVLQPGHYRADDFCVDLLDGIAFLADLAPVTAFVRRFHVDVYIIRAVL